MPDKDDKSMHPGFDKPMFGPAQMYYSELMRIITMLFVGVLALMTFLLTVGFQRPHADFSYALYTTIITLGLNFLAYVVAQIFFLDLLNQKKAEVASDDKAKKDEAGSKSKFEKAKARLRVMRVIQQFLFIVAVASVVWLALETAHFFFTIPTSSSAAGGQ